MLMDVCRKSCSVLAKKKSPPGGLEPPTFRLTAERANQLRHGGVRALEENTGNIINSDSQHHIILLFKLKQTYPTIIKNHQE